MVIRLLPSFSPNGGMNEEIFMEQGILLTSQPPSTLFWPTGLAGPALAFAMVGKVLKSVPEGRGIRDII
jgi:hypothetical protein